MLNEMKELGAHLDTVLLSPDASPDPKLAEAQSLDEAAADKELSLVDLLLEASEAIRAERARADALASENAALRAQLDSVKAAYHRAAAQRQSATTTTDMPDDVFAYVGRGIAHDDDGSEPPPRQRSSTATTTATRSSAASAGRPPSRGYVTVTAQSYSKGWEAAVSTSPSPSGGHQGLTALPAHPAAQVDDKESEQPRNAAVPNSSMQAMACRLRRALAPRPAEAVVGDIIHTMVEALQRDVQAILEAQYAAAPATRLRGFALVRMRPCTYQLLYGPPADVKSMARGVGAALGASLRRSTSPPTATPYRHHYLLYQTTKGQQSIPSRVHAMVVHLTIDSGELRVVRGGGHIDFFEYLERLLHVKIGDA